MNDIINKLYIHNSIALLESPYWDCRGLLFLVSINEHIILRIDISNNKNSFFKVEKYPSKIFYTVDNILCYAAVGGIYLLNLDNGLSVLFKSIVLESGFRFNDGIYIKDEDKFCIGVKGISDNNNLPGGVKLFNNNNNTCFFYSLGGARIPNGMAIDKRNNFYLSISDLNTVYKFIGNPFTSGFNLNLAEEVINFGKHVFPDGICIYDNRVLYVAEWGAGSVSAWSLDSFSLLRRYEFPIKGITSCICGGQNNKTLFVTSCIELISGVSRPTIFSIDIND